LLASFLADLGSRRARLKRRTGTPGRPTTLLLRALLAGCITMLALSPATALANHQGPPLSVSLTAAQSEVTIPERIELDAAADRHVYGTGYSIVIRDQEGGQRVGDICWDTECPANWSTTWSDNANPQPRTFHAELRDPSGTVVATSNNVTVQVRKFVWNVVSVTANPQTGVVPGSITFLATVDRGVYGTGYQIHVYRDGSSYPVKCSDMQCAAGVSRGWADNVSPQPGRVRVEVRGPSGDLASNIVEAEAPFRRLIFPVSLSFSSYTNAAGTVVHEATASTYRSMYGTPYRLKIKRADGTEVCAVNNNDWCRRAVSVGGTYRGVVEDSQGRNFGQSAAWTLTENGPQPATVGDLDMAALAAAAGGADICTRLGLSPYKTNVVGPHTSAGDQWEACAAAVAAGATTLAILVAVADTPGGEANLWWLQSDLTKEAPSAETEPDPDDATAPRPAPPPFIPDVYKLAQTLTENQDIPQPLADDVANQCLFLHWRAGMSGKDDCGRLPIFASGNDVPEATVHDLKALAFSFRRLPPNAQWVRLNYRHQDLTPGDRYWMNAEDECQGRVPGVTACDEYPFWSTMQGGPESIPRPHLKLIDFIDNRDQGLRYGNFIQRCHMNTGDPFLGIPLPPALGIPTQTKICNGH
jgi:hypothetical protein